MFFVSFVNPQFKEGDLVLLQYKIEIHTSDSLATTRYNDSVKDLTNDGFILVKETTFLDGYPLTTLFEPIDDGAYAIRFVSQVNFIYLDTQGVTIILPNSDTVTYTNQFTELILKLHNRVIEEICIN